MRMKLFSKPSHLQQKLTLYSLFWFAFGLLATYVVMVALMKLYLNNYLIQQSLTYSQQTAKDITSIIDRDKETISAFLLSETMRDLNNRNQLTVALERLLSQNKNFLEGYVINQEGQTLVSVSRVKTFASQPDFKKQIIYQQAKSGQISISGWQNFAEMNQPYWYMAIPIEKYPRKVIGVFMATIDLRPIEDTILTSEAAKYGNPVLFDHMGKVLVHLDRSKLGENWYKCPILQKAIHGEIGTSKFYDGNGKLTLAAYQPLHPYNWEFIVYIAPEQTIYFFQHKVILLLSLMILVIIILTGPLTYYAAGRIVTPIKALTQATQKFGRGDPSEYVPVGGNDEIGQLSAAFTQMAASIQDHEKQRAQYISMIAHDLRNPLRLITEYLRMISNDASISEPKFKNPGLVKLEQVNRMINDLLEFSRLDLGQISFTPEMVSVKYICEEVRSGYREQAPKFNILSFSELICVWADPLRFQQILQNIFDNSIKYTPRECTVTIDCQMLSGQSAEGCCMVETIIIDNGPGIPPEIMANLFKPFHPNSYQKEGSYCLGLAIAKKLALGMNGDLIVNSVPGQGVTFRLRLPYKE